MAIPESKYIAITSGVGGSATVATRDLITRIFTQNSLAPAGGQVLEFSSASQVGSYFGLSSEEYKRAVFYFGWVSKNITSPQLLSFMRWTQVAVAPSINGGASGTLAAFQAQTSGSLTMQIGTDVNSFTGIDLSAATDLNDVASIIQTKINTATGTMWTAASVTYSNGHFNFVGGNTATTDAISVMVPTAGFDLATLLGWYNSPAYPIGAIWSPGQAAQTAVQVFDQSTSTSTNFGSYLFIPVLDQSDMIAVASESAASDELYMMLMPVSLANASSYASSIASIGGVALTISPLASEYPEMVPGMIEAATNYAASNSVQNYMFQQFNLTPSVTDLTTAQTLDAIQVNYYGLTQSNGQQIAFYQNGNLSGASVSTNLVPMNIFANESWLRGAAEAALMQLLLSLAKISANKYGRSQILTILQSVIDLALLNGAISIGGLLNATQKAFITQVTNDPLAYQQVQNNGYWVDVVIVPYTVGSVTQYKAVYTLIYKKDDVVSKIEGTHILI